MNELAVQGANDTNEDIDRDAINEELSALTEELDRISSTTQFNKQNLLDGTFTQKNLQVGANTNQKIQISINAMNAAAIGLTSFTISGATSAVTGTKAGSFNKGYSYNGSIYTTSTLVKAAAVADANQNAAASAKITMVASTNGKNYYKASVGTTTTTVRATSVFANLLASVKATGSYAALKEFSAGGSLGAHRVFSKWDATPDVAAVAEQRSKGVDVSNYDAANKSISMIQAAINNVSGQRSYLGALQNRLEHTIANLDNVSENTQSAESRIRDTDMASEMVEYSKNNILAQAGQSMLAQANQSTQGVLSLLG
jgi:flagellin